MQPQAGTREGEHAVAALRARPAGLGTDDPIPYRTRHGGDHDSRLVLREELGGAGPAAHRNPALDQARVATAKIRRKGNQVEPSAEAG